MAAEEQTFTVTDQQPETEVLTEEEQDSLAVGEKLVTEQEGLLAGKYKSAEELEKAYKELESKLGQQDSPKTVQKRLNQNQNQNLLLYLTMQMLLQTHQMSFMLTMVNYLLRLYKSFKVCLVLI